MIRVNEKEKIRIRFNRIRCLQIPTELSKFNTSHCFIKQMFLNGK